MSDNEPRPQTGEHFDIQWYEGGVVIARTIITSHGSVTTMIEIPNERIGFVRDGLSYIMESLDNEVGVT